MRASSCSREQGRVTCWRTTDVSRAAACVSRGFSMRHLLSKRDTADLAALPIIPPSYHPDVLRTHTDRFASLSDCGIILGASGRAAMNRETTGLRQCAEALFERTP